MAIPSQETSIISLDGEWCFAFQLGASPGKLTSITSLEHAGVKSYSCTVPGNFELDLQENGFLKEPFYGMNITKLREYEYAHIWYYRNFSYKAEGGPRDIALVFEGLDCYAEIYLNGNLLGCTDNMLVEHVFPVNGLLQDDNELLIHIKPAMEVARQYHYPPSVAGPEHTIESLYVRKAPHMYGCDIMPRTVSAGIWRPVHLRLRPLEHLEMSYLQTVSVSPTSARHVFHYQAHLTPKPTDQYTISLAGCCGDSEFSIMQPVGFAAGHFSFTIEQPKLWWPRGSGDPNLYDVTVSLQKNGNEVHRQSFRHGVRTATLSRTSVTDHQGNGDFCFLINGERIFVKGTNWVPADAFHSRDHARIPAMVELADDIGCNLIRCWGGNVYEESQFYQLCDEKGIMVWQDFAMASAVYPQDAAFCQRVGDEARKVVRRLRQHASLVLWTGDSECDIVHGEFDMPRRDPNENVLTREVLPRVLRQEDPFRPYLPSSPYIDHVAFQAGSQAMTEDHLWGPRDYFKSNYYTGSLCHFVSEIGYHGCPAPESIDKFISPEHRWPYTDNDEWNLHSTYPRAPFSNQRVQLMTNQVRELFGKVPETLEDFAFASQATQAEAKKFFIEFFRSTKWRRSGIIWWNLIDGWPQFSDAVVDYYFVKKLAFHMIKAVQQPLCLMLREPENWRQELVVVNDYRHAAAVQYCVKDLDTEEILTQGQGTARANEVTVLDTIPFSMGVQRFYVITWHHGGGQGENHYLAGNPPFSLTQYQNWLSQTTLMQSVQASLSTGVGL